MAFQESLVGDGVVAFVVVVDVWLLVEEKQMSETEHEGRPEIHDSEHVRPVRRCKIERKC